jgi:hypothetical protein
MPVRPHHHRVPRARIDPITDADIAVQLIVGALSHPPRFESVVLVLDDAHRGVGIVSVSGTPHPDQAVEVVECLARPELFDGQGAALVIGSSRPNGGIVDGDLDRWLEMCDLAETSGFELVEWFVIGSTVRCPRDLTAIRPRWRGAAARPA